MALLELDSDQHVLRTQPHPLRRIPRGGKGGGRLPRRAQRGGEKHHVPLHHRVDAAAVGGGPLQGGEGERPARVPDLPEGDRLRPGGPAMLPGPHGAREPRGCGAPGKGDDEALERGAGLRPLPAPAGAGEEPREPAVRRRAADADDRPHADDEPRGAPPRRAVRRARPAGGGPAGGDDPPDPQGGGDGPPRGAEPALLRQGLGPRLRDRQGVGEVRGAR